MTAHELDALHTVIELSTDEEFSIPLDISDIIYICQEYNKLGWQIQHQMENILEYGVEESINKGAVKKESLPHMKTFLKAICRNPYFGDATSQANDCIVMIESFEKKSKSLNSLFLN